MGVLVANGAAGRTRAKFPGHKRQVASWRGRWQGDERRTALSRVCSRLGIQRIIDSSMMGNDGYDGYRRIVVMDNDGRIDDI